MAIREQQIIEAIVARMQTILISNGYQTDIGTNVEDSRTNWDEADLPAISVFDGTVTPTDLDDEGHQVTRTMPVMVKCFWKRQDTAALDAAFARKALRDIHAAVKVDRIWKAAGVPLVTNTTEKPHGVERAAETFEITGVQAEMEIEYYANAFDMEP